MTNYYNTNYYNKCKLSNNWIQFKINESIADMTLFEIDYTNFKLFCKLLRETVDELTDKYKVKYIRQMVNISEYNEFLKSKTTWKIIESTESIDLVLIECDIRDFVDNFAGGCGIK